MHLISCVRVFYFSKDYCKQFMNIKFSVIQPQTWVQLDICSSSALNDITNEERYDVTFFVSMEVSTVPNLIFRQFPEGRRYSAVTCFWPVEELAQLADGPIGCGEVARGGCLFAWNCNEVNCTYGEQREGLDRWWRCRCFSDSLLAYRLKIPLAKNRALHYRPWFFPVHQSP
jgi:hypothetical protein